MVGTKLILLRSQRRLSNETTSRPLCVPEELKKQGSSSREQKFMNPPIKHLFVADVLLAVLFHPGERISFPLRYLHANKTLIRIFIKTVALRDGYWPVQKKQEGREGGREDWKFGG